MNIKFSTIGYVATALLAAYVSYDLANEVGATYHIGALAKASGGLALFAFLTGAMWTTIAQGITLLASERRCRLVATIAKFVAFFVGYGCISLFAWDFARETTGLWRSVLEVSGAVLGMGTFACIGLFAAPAPPEETGAV